MKILITTMLVFVFYYGNAQNWYTLDKESYIPFSQTQLTGFINGYAKTTFKTNHYDTSVWLLNKGSIMKFNKNGQFQRFSESDHPNFDNFANFRAITFTPNAVLVSSPYYGIFKFDGLSWIQSSGVNGSNHLYADQDTIWMSRPNGTPSPSYFLKVTPSSASFGNYGFSEFYARSGEYWGVNGTTLRKYHDSGSVLMFADTIDFLLETQNRSFNYSSNNNKFYVGGNKGISVAENHQFIDTITPYNTVGMPLLPVIEIEFDSQDNLWVVFGENDPFVDDPYSIGYLDRTTSTWTIYDSSNSPITDDFGAIEVDACDNLWVIGYPYIRVLTAGNCSEDWLSLDENTAEQFLIYPNPSSGQFVLENSHAIQSIDVTDLLGRSVDFQLENEKLHIFKKGVFHVKINTATGLQSTLKVIVE